MTARPDPGGPGRSSTPSPRREGSEARIAVHQRDRHTGDRLPVPAHQITVTRMAPTARRAAVALRSYYHDIVSRYHGLEASEEEIDAAMRDEPGDDLAPPRGLLLVACADDTVLGCAGLRLLPDDIGEVTRVHVAVNARGRGLGSRLLRELEDEARPRQLSTLRLDTRGDLVEARRLYARHGYHEVAPFNRDPYADHWFAKSLGPDQSAERGD
jgi:ribosomal protein S18 acetylase RimI-like enzyme